MTRERRRFWGQTEAFGVTAGVGGLRDFWRRPSKRLQECQIWGSGGRSGMVKPCGTIISSKDSSTILTALMQIRKM